MAVTVRVRHYHSASAIISAFAASAVALPARVDLDPFVHCLLSCNDKVNWEKTLVLCLIDCNEIQDDEVTGSRMELLISSWLFVIHSTYCSPFNTTIESGQNERTEKSQVEHDFILNLLVIAALRLNEVNRNFARLSHHISRRKNIAVHSWNFISQKWVVTECSTTKITLRLMLCAHSKHNNRVS